jgi:DNA modification methylase
MIRDDELPELGELRRVEAEFPFRTDLTLADQVVAASNDTQPVHRWFRFKESFAPALLRRIISALYPDGLPRELRILDPFTGVGTTLLAAEQLARENRSNTTIHATGIEQNPFIHFAARTKINWRHVQLQQFLRAGERAIERATHTAVDLPELSSIRSGRCISQYVSKSLLAIQHAIRDSTNGATRDALLLGVAAGIEALSKVRKDGRALRIVRKSHPQIRTVLTSKWNQIHSDCETLARTATPPTFQSTLIYGDGRDLNATGIPNESIDLVFTSPPYPNNIDYTEVYKLELWLLGFIQTEAEFFSLRKTTFRSHPTCATPDAAATCAENLKSGTLERLLGPVLKRAEAQAWRHRLFEGYFSDMWKTLEECHRCLRKGGHAVFVVGNSLHGRPGSAYLVPTDLAIAGMARSIGFETHETIIARTLKRRLSGNHFLRESIVTVRRPDA